MESSNYNLFGNQQISHIAQIGVQIEPEANVLQQTTATVRYNIKNYIHVTVSNIILIYLFYRPVRSHI